MNLFENERERIEQGKEAERIGKMMKDKNIKPNDMVDIFLEMIASDENAPMSFKVLRAEKKLHNRTFDLLRSLKNADELEDKNLSALLTYFEQGEKLLDDIEKKMKGE